MQCSGPDRRWQYRSIATRRSHLSRIGRRVLRHQGRCKEPKAIESGRGEKQNSKIAFGHLLMNPFSPLAAS